MTRSLPSRDAPRSLERYVHAIRTSGKTDSYWSKRLGIGKSAIRQARIGDTYRNHPAPPDVRRRSGGKYTSDEAKHLPVTEVTSSEISLALRRWRLPRIVSSEGMSP